MASSNSVVVKFLADTSQMNKGIQKVNGQLSGFATAAKGIGVAIAGAFAVGKIADFGKEIVDLASQMEQAAGATETLFGKSAAKTIEEWASTTAEAFGISSVAATEAANTFSVAGKAIGLSGDDLVDFSTNLVGISADLGAAFGDTEGAIRAIGSALRGEFDPLERYGIQLNATTLQAYAFEQGITTAYSSLDNATKQGLISQYIEDQTKLLGITGQNAREQDTYAGKLARVQAKFEDLQIALGEKLLPVLVKLLDGFILIIDAISGLDEFLGKNKETIEKIAVAVGVFTVVVIANKVAVSGAAIANGIYSASVLGLVRAIDLATAAQARFNAMVRANPYVIAATAIAFWAAETQNLTRKFIEARKEGKSFGDIVQNELNGIEDAFRLSAIAAGATGTFFYELGQDISSNWKDTQDDIVDSTEQGAKDSKGAWSPVMEQIVVINANAASRSADYWVQASNIIGTAAEQARRAWETGQASYLSAPLSGTVSSAISAEGYKDAAGGLQTGWDDLIGGMLDEAFEKGGKSGGSKAREAAEEELEKIGKGWVGEFSTIDVYVGKRLQKVNSELASEYQSRLSALKAAQVNYEQVVTESIERVAEKLEETKKQMSETFLGFNLDDFVKVEGDLTIFDSEAFNNYINDKNELATRLGGVVGQIPNLWIEQIAGMGPEAANATLDYLLGTDGNVSTQGTNAISKYQDLADNVYTNLATPYAETMRKVYEEAEAEGIQAAKDRVEEEAESFKKWSKNKLKHSIPVTVVYKADFSQAGPAYNGGGRSATYTVKNIQDYERLNGSKWRDRVR